MAGGNDKDAKGFSGLSNLVSTIRDINLEVERDLPSLRLKSTPKSCGWLGDCSLTSIEHKGLGLA